MFSFINRPKNLVVENVLHNDRIRLGISIWHSNWNKQTEILPQLYTMSLKLYFGKIIYLQNVGKIFRYS